VPENAFDPSALEKLLNAGVLGLKVCLLIKLLLGIESLKLEHVFVKVWSSLFTLYSAVFFPCSLLARDMLRHEQQRKLG
jgi:hypothetical protein